MAQAIGAVLAFAVGVGISPVPVIAVIVMLFSSRARVNGPAFLGGWALSLAVVSTATYLVADGLDVGSSSDATDGVSWVKVVLGVVLLALAVRRWRNRPGPEEQPEMPKWMSGIDRFSPGKAFGLAVVLAAVNPKNLALTIGAGASLAHVAPTTGEAAVGLVVFVAVASSVVALAVGYQLAGGARARQTLDDGKAWLAAHDSAVMSVLFTVFGAVLLSQGLALR